LSSFRTGFEEPNGCFADWLDLRIAPEHEQLVNLYERFCSVNNILVWTLITECRRSYDPVPEILMNVKGITCAREPARPVAEGRFSLSFGIDSTVRMPPSLTHPTEDRNG
jgi:hypothetical protein